MPLPPGAAACDTIRRALRWTRRIRFELGRTAAACAPVRQVVNVSGRAGRPSNARRNPLLIRLLGKSAQADAQRYAGSRLLIGYRRSRPKARRETFGPGAA